LRLRKRYDLICNLKFPKTALPLKFVLSLEVVLERYTDNMEYLQWE